MTEPPPVPPTEQRLGLAVRLRLAAALLALTAGLAAITIAILLVRSTLS